MLVEWRKLVCEIICGAPTTLVVKGKMRESISTSSICKRHLCGLVESLCDAERVIGEKGGEHVVGGVDCGTRHQLHQVALTQAVVEANAETELYVL